MTMKSYIIYILVFVLLFFLQILYFCVAKRFNIIDKPNERSSHSTIVLRGGGIIFLLAIWVWSIFWRFQYPWFLFSITLVAIVSFIDDIRSLPDLARLIVQFIAMILMFYQLDILHQNQWIMLFIGLIICVGATNIINFMDGINGITVGYSLAVIIPLALLNVKHSFIEQSYLIVTILALLVFAYFNFRSRGKAKCFAGDVGSISIAFIILFALGKIIVQTHDATYLIFLVVYGIDGCFTILHRIMLHENLGDAHRKHAFQIMANELHIDHVKVALFYLTLQLVISLVYILIIPKTYMAHWLYFIGIMIFLGVGYVLFMKKYYHLHESYLKSLKMKKYERNV